MKNENIGSENKELYYRLITLWVVCEAFAGGVMHATKIPFSGMMVSSLAVICITLIAYYIPGNGNILKASVIVAIFKLMLSPHSPPTAYIAVFFQGYMGQLLFHGKRHFALSAIIFSVLALVESALQRLLVLLIIYGNSFWHAADEYITKTVGGTNKNYSLLLASGYIFVHAVAGIFVGIFAVRAIKNYEKRKSGYDPLLLNYSQKPSAETEIDFGKKKSRKLFILLWLVLIILFIQAYIYPQSAVLPHNDVFRILLRSLVILLSWYFIFTPIIKKLIAQKLRSQKVKQQTEIKKVLQLLPEIKYIFMQSWILSSSLKGFSRIKLFLKILLFNILSKREEI